MAAPKLRFKEFDGNWTLTTLNQLSTKIGDGIHATPKYDESGTIPFINGNNLVNGRIVINENTKRISSEEFQKYNQILSDRTLFLSINGTIGNLAFYKNEKVLLGKSVCFINLKNDLDKKFIYLLLQSPQLTKTLNSELTGTTIKNLSLATVRNSEFYCPIEAEQTKIASFLSTVDEKISQLSQKHQLLSQYKQGMMQKLFSQQIRFKADDGSAFGEWEETTLKDCVTSIDSGWSPQCESYSTDLNEWGVLKTTSVDWKGFNASFNKKLPDQLTPRLELEVQPLDILVTRAGPTDRVGVVSIVPENVRSKLMISDKLIRLKTNEKNNPTFLGISLSSVKCQNQLQSKTSGLAKSQTNISQKILGDVVLKLPSKEEQTKIANFLSSIDQKIEVVVQQIEQAKQWKKGLLQQMFV